MRTLLALLIGAPLALAAMILGILALLGLVFILPGFILGLIALILGIMGVRRANAIAGPWAAGERVLGALAGFEKSGHFFFNEPIGRGYDDGLLTAIAVIEMLDRNPDKSMADLRRDLPKTWGSPTMSPKCADEVKYDVVDRVVARFKEMHGAGEKIAGQSITDLITVNGIRVVSEDGTWGLVRASSNKPELVVVVESPASEARLHEMFKAVDAVLRENPEVGEYNQTL